MTAPLHYAAIQTRLRELSTFAASIIPTTIPVEPRPSEIEAVIDDLDALWSKVDPVVEAIAEYVQHMTGHKIDKQWKVDQLRGALEGNLTHEIQSAAQKLRDDIMQAAE